MHTPGVYRVTTGATNVPSDNGFLIVFLSAENNIVQIGCDHSGNQFKHRTYWYGTWNDWKNILTNADFASTIQYYATGNSEKWINIPYPSGYNKDNCYVSITYTGTAVNDMVVFKINENTGQFCYMEIKGSNFGINARFLFFRK